jgi:uncharacterized membrane protein YdjX (TVP38/TMEM64 family)
VSPPTESTTTNRTGAANGPPTGRHAATWVRRAVVVAAWIAVVVAWRRHQQAAGLGTLDTAQRFVEAVETAWWGVLAYVGAYLVRPLLLFPASVITVVGGWLFGPVVGVLVVVVAANLSAAFAYGIGRLLGGAPPADAETVVRRWGLRMRERSFETVLVMRLVFLPYDLVNVVAGGLRIRFVPFLAATALGSLPGTISFVLLGASIDDLEDGVGGIDPRALAAGVAVLVVSLLAARWLRRREEEPPGGPPMKARHERPVTKAPS